MPKLSLRLFLLNWLGLTAVLALLRFIPNELWREALGLIAVGGVGALVLNRAQFKLLMFFLVQILGLVLLIPFNFRELFLLAPSFILAWVAFVLSFFLNPFWETEQIRKKAFEICVSFLALIYMAAALHGTEYLLSYLPFVLALHLAVTTLVPQDFALQSSQGSKRRVILLSLALVLILIFILNPTWPGSGAASRLEEQIWSALQANISANKSFSFPLSTVFVAAFVTLTNESFLALKLFSLGCFLVALSSAWLICRRSRLGGTGVWGVLIVGLSVSGYRLLDNPIDSLGFAAACLLAVLSTAEPKRFIWSLVRLILYTAAVLWHALLLPLGVYLIAREIKNLSGKALAYAVATVVIAASAVLILGTPAVIRAYLQNPGVYLSLGLAHSLNSFTLDLVLLGGALISLAYLAPKSGLKNAVAFYFLALCLAPYNLVLILFVLLLPRLDFVFETTLSTQKPEEEHFPWGHVLITCLIISALQNVGTMTLRLMAG